MAARFLLTDDVSDLCIGKPPLRWLPPSSTVAHTVAELDSQGPEAAVAVWDGAAEGTAVAGKVRMADVILFLCADDGNNLASPTAALQATLADLLAAAGAPPIRRVEPDASVLEAVDALLDGAQSLVVPIRDHRRASAAEETMCWLTVEDVVRFFLGSVTLFSPTASRSVSDLGAVRPACRALAAAAINDALSDVVLLLRNALAMYTYGTMVSGLRLECEISPSMLCSLDASVGALSAGELVSLVDSGRAPQEAALRRRNLLDGGHDPSSPPSSSSSSSSSITSSSSSEDDEEGNDKPAYTGQGGRHGSSYSARWTKGREPIACRRGSSLVAVMAQAVAHRVTQLWVLEDEPEEELIGVVGLLDVLRVLRHHLLHTPPAPI